MQLLAHSPGLVKHLSSPSAPSIRVVEVCEHVSIDLSDSSVDDSTSIRRAPRSPTPLWHRGLTVPDTTEAQPPSVDTHQHACRTNRNPPPSSTSSPSLSTNHRHTPTSTSSLSLRARRSQGSTTSPSPSLRRGHTVPLSRRHPSRGVESKKTECNRDGASSALSFTPSVRGQQLASWFSGLLGRGASV